MRSIGFPELIIIAVILAAVIIPIWIARKAKPIGTLPYRWGTYLGVSTAVWAIWMLLFAAFIKNNSEARFVFLGFTALSLATSFGLLKRYRWGVIVFFVLVLPVVFFTRLPGPTNLFGPLINWGLEAVALLCSAVYFRKRWDVLR